jgi:hypothetical protein
MRKGDLCLLCTNSRDAVLLNRNDVGTSNGVTHPRAHFSPFRVSALAFLLLLASLLLLAPILLITSLLLYCPFHRLGSGSGIPVVVWCCLASSAVLVVSYAAVKPAVFTVIVTSLESLHVHGSWTNELPSSMLWL